MATAFYGQMTITHGDGTLETDRFTCADTSLIYCLWTSSGLNKFYTVRKDGYITDILLNITSAGTTKYFKVWINETDTNIYGIQSACFPALTQRFPAQSPIPVKAGQQIMLQAIT
jgi:hypothetical protein